MVDDCFGQQLVNRASAAMATRVASQPPPRHDERFLMSAMSAGATAAGQR
jgi:hypothetical protein